MEQNDKNKVVAGSRRAYKISAKRVKVTGILLLAIVFVALLLMSPIFKVKSIVIQKESKKNTDIIIKELGFSKGDNIFSIDINKAIERVEKIERVDNCTIERTLPGKVIVTVNEKSECGYIKISSGYAGVDETGKVMAVLKTKEEKVPLVNGVKIADPQKNSYIKVEGEKAKEKADITIRLLSALKEHGIVDLVKSVELKDLKNVSIVLTSDTKVNFGKDGEDNEEKIEYKVAFLKAILEKDEFKNGGVIELADTNNVTARMS